MKGNKIMGIAWIVIAALLFFFLIAGLMGKRNGINIFGPSSNGKFAIEDGSSAEKQYFSTKDVNSIELNVTSASIAFEETDDDQIAVELYGFEEDAPKVKLLGDVLEIEQKSKNFFNVHIADFNKKAVLIKLPSGYNPDQVEAYSASGAIHFTNCTIIKAEIKTASGSIHIDNCTSDLFEAASSSGSITVTNCNINNLECTNASGSIKIDGSFDGIELRSVSGSVHAELSKPLSKDSEVSSTSGSLKLSTPKDSNLDITYSAVSGTYKNTISGTSGGKKGKDRMGSNGPKLELRTTSGSIRVE